MSVSIKLYNILVCVPGPEVDGDAVDESVRAVLPDEVERLPVLDEHAVLTLQDLPPV